MWTFLSMTVPQMMRGSFVLVWQDNFYGLLWLLSSLRWSLLLPFQLVVAVVLLLFLVSVLLLSLLLFWMWLQPREQSHQQQSQFNQTFEQPTAGSSPWRAKRGLPRVGLSACAPGGSRRKGTRCQIREILNPFGRGANIPHVFYVCHTRLGVHV